MRLVKDEEGVLELPYLLGGAVNLNGVRQAADEREASTTALARAGLGRLISEWQRRGYVRVEAS